MEQNSSSNLETFLFCKDIRYCKAALDGGCSAIVIDWEYHGKKDRQAGFDTEVNHAIRGTLSQMRKTLSGKLVTRINNIPSLRRKEVQLAFELGSDEIWLPMVRNINEVIECLETVKGKIPLSVQVETNESLELGPQLEDLPLARVYIGLNDLHIDRGGHGHLFTPLIDGTIDKFRDTFSGRLGVAGITAPKLGNPIPQKLLLAAMARLNCTFGVARRSFRRDIPIGEIEKRIHEIGDVFSRLQRRTYLEIAADHAVLTDTVSRLEAKAAAG